MTLADDQETTPEAPELRRETPAGHRWYTYYRNPLSAFGLVLALAGGIFHLSIFARVLSGDLFNPYLNIWLYVVIPPIVVAGFALAVYGAWRERRRIRRLGLSPEVVAAGRGRRGLVLGGVLALILLMPFVGFTSYTGYNFTDSVEFCGQVCHTPMHPVFTAYQVSPHARVSCSSCHIGEGASWFARSKLSGTRQVFATLLDSFHRPIETPIENLRPARETCERCHWPEKAFGSRVVDLPHYACDERNTHRQLSMVLKTGGGDPDLVQVRGIHWHSIAAHRIEYVAVDAKRLEIPWVRVTSADGEKVFRSDGLPAEAPAPQGERRVMDCLDCHNRPSHNYRSPDEITNTLFSHGFLEPSFPYLKREVARLMAQPYESTDAAREAISGGLEDFYRENYPELASDRSQELTRGIDAALQAYGNNFFPEMKTDWRTHPDHIGHKYSPGCFRCHDDRHAAADGSVISRTCDQCHEFMEHREAEGMQVLVPGSYRHPFELGSAHEALSCHLCHDGGPTPPPSCVGCHGEVQDFMAGRMAGLSPPTGEPHPHSEELACIDCHEDSRRLDREDVPTLCLDCHDEDEEHILALEAVLEDLENAREQAGGAPVVEELDRLGPVHNLGFALELLQHRGPATESD